MEKNHHISIVSNVRHACTLNFELQPIVFPKTSRVFGYELLYRGLVPANWSDVDVSVIQHFLKEKRSETLFINLSNEGLLRIDEREFVEASKNNNLIFELSESHADNATYQKISEKVNSLASQGLRFALDDFGIGLDGLHRLYSLNSVSVIKIDGSLIQAALIRSDAQNTLRSLIQHWDRANIQSVAECIENTDLYDCAKSLGVTLLQGWHVDSLVSALRAPQKSLSSNSPVDMALSQH